MGWNIFKGIGESLFPGKDILKNEKGREAAFNTEYDYWKRQVKPFNISTSVGDLTYDSGTGTMKWAPSSDMANYVSMLTGADAQTRLRGLLGGGSGTDFTAGVLGQMRDLAAPYEQRQRDELDAKLLARGMLTGTEGGYAQQGLYTAQSEADKRRMLDAYGLRERLLSGELGRSQVGYTIGQGPESLYRSSIAGMQAAGGAAGKMLDAYQNEMSQRRKWDVNRNENAKDAWSMIMAGFGMNIGSGRKGGGVNSGGEVYNSNQGAFGNDNSNYWAGQTGTGQGSWADMSNVYSGGGTSSGSTTGWGFGGQESYGQGGGSSGIFGGGSSSYGLFGG